MSRAPAAYFTTGPGSFWAPRAPVWHAVDDLDARAARCGVLAPRNHYPTEDLPDRAVKCPTCFAR